MSEKFYNQVIDSNRKILSFLQKIIIAKRRAMSKEQIAEIERRKQHTEAVLGDQLPPLIEVNGRLTAWHPDIDKELGYVPFVARKDE
jgi:hypothetical protein